MLEGGVRSGTSQIATRMTRPPMSGRSVPPQAGERDRLGSRVAEPIAAVGHAAGTGRRFRRRLGELLERAEVVVGELPDRLPPEADEHARPAVAGLEPAVVDDPRPARERLQPPRPADLELRREDRDPERRVGPGLEALDVDRGAEQAEVDLARGGPSRRPATTGRPLAASARRRGAARSTHRGALSRRASATR